MSPSTKLFIYVGVDELNRMLLHLPFHGEGRKLTVKEGNKHRTKLVNDLCAQLQAVL